MKIYKKYLFKNLLKHFLLILFIFTAIIWTTRVIRYVYLITEYGIDIKGFLKIIVSVLPNLLLITIPISAFITVILTYNKLIKNNELVVLENAGLKKSYMIFPPLFLSFFLCALSFAITLYFLPKSNREFDNIKLYLKNSVTNILLNNSNNFNNFDNITLYTKNIVENNILNSLTIYIKDKEKTTDKILHAKRGILDGNYITLFNGELQEFNRENSKDVRFIFFEKYVIDISQYYNLNDIKGNIDEDSMFLQDLFKIKDKNQEIVAEIIERFANPLVSIVLTVFSAVLVLHLNFSRMENNKQLFGIYLICMVDLALFLYSMKALKEHMAGIYVTILSFLFPMLWSVVVLKRN